MNIVPPVVWGALLISLSPRCCRNNRRTRLLQGVCKLLLDLPLLYHPLIMMMLMVMMVKVMMMMVVIMTSISFFSSILCSLSLSRCSSSSSTFLLFSTSTSSSACGGENVGEIGKWGLQEKKVSRLIHGCLHHRISQVPQLTGASGLGEPDYIKCTILNYCCWWY